MQIGIHQGVTVKVFFYLLLDSTALKTLSVSPLEVVSLMCFFKMILVSCILEPSDQVYK